MAFHASRSRESFYEQAEAPQEAGIGLLILETD